MLIIINRAHISRDRLIFMVSKMRKILFKHFINVFYLLLSHVVSLRPSGCQYQSNKPEGDWQKDPLSQERLSDTLERKIRCCDHHFQRKMTTWSSSIKADLDIKAIDTRTVLSPCKISEAFQFCIMHHRISSTLFVCQPVVTVVYKVASQRD